MSRNGRYLSWLIPAICRERPLCRSAVERAIGTPQSRRLALRAAGFLIAIGVWSPANLGTPAAAEEQPAAAAATVRDKLWIFTAPAGADNDALKQAHFPRMSRMTPAEGAFYLGVPNLMLVSFQGKPEPPFDQDAIPFRPLKQVVWCLNGPNGKIVERQGRKSLFDFARRCPNLTGFLLDDFFNDLFPKNGPDHVSLDQLRELRKELVIDGKRRDLYVVVYQHQLDLPIKPYFDLCDKVTYWTWHAKDLINLEKDFQRLERLVPDRPKLLGCYFWDFGGGRPMPLELMQKQCRLGLKWLREGRIEGIILLANTMADLDLPAVEWTRKWIAEVGGQPIVKRWCCPPSGEQKSD